MSTDNEIEKYANERVKFYKEKQAHAEKQIFEVMKLLRKEEKQLTGKILNVPVNQELWDEKAHWVGCCLDDLLKIENSIFHATANKMRVSECLKIEERWHEEILRNSKFNNGPLHGITYIHINTDEWLTGLYNDKEKYLRERTLYRGIIYEDEPLDMNEINAMFEQEFPTYTYKEVIQQFLNFNYQIPKEDKEIKFHLLAYWIYLTNIRFLGFFYPSVNERINFVGLKLIQRINWLIAECTMSGKGIDQVKNAIDKKMSKADDRLETIKELLEKYPNYKSDKNERNNFYAEARKATGLTTDAGINNHLRKILGEEKK